MARMDKDAYMALRMAGRPAEELMAPGGRKAIAKLGEELAARGGDLIRQSFGEDAGFIERFIATLKQGALDRDRTCVNTVARIYKLTDQENKLATLF